MFSRTANWFERGFIFSTRSIPWRLLGWPGYAIRGVVGPKFELAVFPKQELQSFGDNVRRTGVKKFGVPVQIAPDFFLQTNLKICSFRMLMVLSEVPSEFLLFLGFVLELALPI